MFPRTVLIVSCLALAACAEKAAPPVPPSGDFVSVTLGQAAEQAHGELAMLARLRGVRLVHTVHKKPPSRSLDGKSAVSSQRKSFAIGLNAIGKNQMDVRIMFF